MKLEKEKVSIYKICQSKKKNNKQIEYQIWWNKKMK
jgi:hypothetical protein